MKVEKAEWIMEAEGYRQKAEVNSFRDLIVWRKSMDLVSLVYEISRSFPDSERFGLTNQIRRASVSIPSNIAEGYGRNSTGDYIRFLQIASGSLYELQTQLEIAENLNFIQCHQRSEADSLATECEKMLSSLIKKLRSRLNS